MRLGNLYKPSRGTNTSHNSSEESITNKIPILEPIVEDKTLSESSSSRASKAHASMGVLETYSMDFNVRLAFPHTNADDA